MSGHIYCLNVPATVISAMGV